MHETVRGVLPLPPVSTLAITASVILMTTTTMRAQVPVDFENEIQPMLAATCAGGGCHIGERTSGVELTSYETLTASVGAQYAREIVVPFDAASSPLVDKISTDSPLHGRRMPIGGDPLTTTEIGLVTRWIDEGASPSLAQETIRGDITRDDVIDISDPIAILAYLFLGDIPPHCDPVADATADGHVDISDPVLLLHFLFLAGQPPPPLSEDEAAACDVPNRAPEVEPIGTITGREDMEVLFSIVAFDPDRNSLTFTADSVPDGLTVDAEEGSVSWTPVLGQAGDHRIRIRVSDDGVPRRSTFATGLIRIASGNHPPTLERLVTVYGREGVSVEARWHASDSDGDALQFELVEGPERSSIDSETGEFLWTPGVGDAGEHSLLVRVTDDGDPPRSAQSDSTLVILEADSPVNQAPTLPSLPVYRTYSGFPIELTIDATDPDGHGLTYTAEGMPDGAELDSETGELRWTPTEDQVGPIYISFRVRDDGVPPQSSEGLLLFRILPPDPCARPVCDPGTGCTEDVVDLDELCCGAAPETRIPEVVAGCPQGRVLHVGRNRQGFGRLQNCDRLRVEPFGQGGHTVRLNVEARCIDSDEPVSMRLRLESESFVLFDVESIRSAQLRNDGFAQWLALFTTVDRSIPVFELEDAPALLTCVLVDANGVRLERRLRVVLQRGSLNDLPEPDIADIPAGEIGCVGCHRPLGSDGARHGIEDAHPWFPLTCTECHGGNPTVSTREFAHVVPHPADPAELRGLSSDELDDVTPEYLQFINPGDLRVASRGCGAENAANPGSGCHESVVVSVRKSVMATYAGHYTMPRYLAGSQSRSALLAAVDRVDESFDPETAPPGAVRVLEALREPDPAISRDDVGTCIDTYLPKSCPTCHLNDFGADNSAGNYRSSGCTACHMTYDEDGLSRSDDPAVNHDFPSHPSRHTLTSAIPTEQCARCHFQGGRIGLAYRGIREGGFGPEQTPPNGVTLGRVLHAHDENYYFTDEDDTNDIDETPPDVHFSAGMDCADCHIGGDVHGDGHMYQSERYQVGVRCEDCHGTVRGEIQPDPEDGSFKNSKGFVLSRVRRGDDGQVLLRLAVSGEEIEIPQVHRILESRVNQAMIEAMGVNESGFSHTDSMECYACHTSWRQTCFGCHVTIDDRAFGPNLTTGESSRGAISVSRDGYSTDFFALGVNDRGKITPLCSSMSVFVSYIDENGSTHYRDRRRTSSDGRNGFGWNPFHHHTVSRVPQNCDRCHPVESGVPNDATLRETYGFGNRSFLVTDDTGEEHDVTAFLGEDGELIGDFPHPNTGPVPREIRERVLSITVTPHPRQ